MTSRDITVVALAGGGVAATPAWSPPGFPRRAAAGVDRVQTLRQD